MTKKQMLIEERIQCLEQMVVQKEKELRKAPSGILKINKHGNGWQYYLRENEKDKNGKYIKKTNEKLIKSLAQKVYDEKVMKRAEAELNILKRLRRVYSMGVMEEVYENFSVQYKEQIHPIIEPEESLMQKWMSIEYTGNEIWDNAPVFYSEKGERMRSKSEVIIANMLKTRNVFYHYEKPIILNGYGKVYPDFTLWDVKRGREIYWEHLGMMDNEEYYEKNFAKIVGYERNGFFIGEQLILTYETSKHPIDMKILDRKIDHLKENCGID